jgi:hypothetical protein
LGLPEFFSVSLPACHGLIGLRQISTSSPLLDASVLPSVNVKTLGIRNLHFEAVPTLQGARHPYGLQDLCLRLIYLVRNTSRRYSSIDPRLDTGEWLTLSNLHYCKSPDRDFHPARYTELSSAR